MVDSVLVVVKYYYLHKMKLFFCGFGLVEINGREVCGELFVFYIVCGFLVLVFSFFFLLVIAIIIIINDRFSH